MIRGDALALGALVLGLAASAAGQAGAGAPREAVRLVVPHERSSVDVLASFAAEACSAAPVSAASSSPSPIERAIVRATGERAIAAADASPTAGSIRGDERCLVRAERSGGLLVVAARAPGAIEAAAAVPWDAQLEALGGETRSLTEETVRAARTRLAGRGYVGAVAARGRAGGALLYAARADAVDVYAIGFDARGRLRAARLASGERPAGTRAMAPPRRALATLHVDGDAVEVTWADRREPYAVSVDGDSVRFEPVAPCAALGHRIGGLCAARIEGRDYFSSRPLPAAGAVDVLPSAFYARVESWIRGADGSTHRVSAQTTTGGRVVVGTSGRADAPRGRGRRREAGIPGRGLAVAIADLDLDGQAEILASSDQPIGERDRLSLFRLRTAGTLVRLWRGEELSGSVALATTADVDGDGRDELLAIEEPASAAGEATLWVVR